MSRLLALRRRIQTVSTIRKTSHAMRLTAMSLHGKIVKQVRQLESYVALLEETAKKHGLAIDPGSVHTPGIQHYTIALGSAKGLCGNFNVTLGIYLKRHEYSHFNLVLGRHVAGLLTAKGMTIDHVYADFNSAKIIDLASHIIHMTQEAASHTGVAIEIAAMHPVSFFLQRPFIKTLLWDRRDTSNAVGTKLKDLYLRAQLHAIVLNNLIAEQAARFVSMDTAARNADEFLGQMKIEYNKVRQTLITQELNELIGGINARYQ